MLRQLLWVLAGLILAYLLISWALEAGLIDFSLFGIY